MGMEESHTEVSGGGTAGGVADLPSDWRRQMDEETKAFLVLDNTGEMKDDEFTARDAMAAMNGVSLASATRRLKKHVEQGAMTVRKAYDPRIGKQVNAYKMV